MFSIISSRYTAYLAVVAVALSVLASEPVFSLLPDAVAATIASVAGFVLLLTRSLAPTAPSPRDVLGSRFIAILSAVGVVAGALIEGGIVDMLPGNVGLAVMIVSTFVLALSRSLTGAEDKDGNGVPDWMEVRRNDAREE